MLILPELAVALRQELRETLSRFEAEAVSLSIWRKARRERAAQDIALLRRALDLGLDLILWQKGVWAEATSVRTRATSSSATSPSRKRTSVRRKVLR